MPCNDGGYARGESPSERLDELTAAVCEYLARRESCGDVPDDLPPKLAAWWERHKEWDKQRRRDERRQRREEIKRLEQQSADLSKRLDKLRAKEKGKGKAKGG